MAEVLGAFTRALRDADLEGRARSSHLRRRPPWPWVYAPIQTHHGTMVCPYWTTHAVIQ
jgi:hypothetical protein